MTRRTAVLTALLLMSVSPFASAAPADDTLADRLVRAAPQVDAAVLQRAADAVMCAGAADATPARRLAVIDYSRPSTERRLWMFDLDTGALLESEWVAHGQGSGDDIPAHFSNRPGSHQSSLGLFRTGATYVGRNGYSLRLEGLEPGINDKAAERAVVMHGADYVSEDTIQRLGRLGRSWGCPALRRSVARRMIDTLAHGQYLYAYFPDKDWLASPGHCMSSGPDEAMRITGPDAQSRAP